ncbi:MAG TPA: HEAT repeat domain-containing protein, partial [Polyangiaceae bacterium LLY-WYZ-15_(1-7)]|nr:HEAT repeat domain-containing protein [Polyangiaceae bacterium LLY-WYZ-15_(1-7)]
MGFEWEGRLGRLERQLETGDVRQRREVVRLLTHYPAEEVREPLLRALRDPDPAVRREAADAAGAVRLRAAGPLLAEWLEDPDPDVRAGAARALGRIGDPRPVPSLVRALGDASAAVRRAAVVALAAMGDEEGVEVVVPLLGRLDDDDPEVRVEAAHALGALGDPRAVVPLVGRARDESPDVRQAVYGALGALGDPRASAALVQALRDENQSARLAAIAALGRLGAPRAVEPLVDLLRDRDARAARAAVVALGAIGGAAARAAVVQALGISELRETAAEVLVGLAGAERTEELGRELATLRDPDHVTALAAVLARRLEAQPTPATAGPLLETFEARRGDEAVLMRALAASGEPEVLVPLLERFDPGAPEPGLVALERYFELHPGDGRAADPLLAALGEVDDAQRRRVVRLLGHIGARRALPALRPLASADDDALRLAAVEAIGAIGDPEGATALIELLDAEEPRLRFEAARALGEAASPAMVEALGERLEAREPVDRAAVLEALGGALARGIEPGDPATLAARLERAARGPDRPLAARAIDALARWGGAGGEHARPVVLALAGPGPAHRRLPALRALAAFDDDDARARLREALGDERTEVRLAAATALGEVGRETDVPALIDLAREGAWPASAGAAFALARLARREVRPEGLAEGLCAVLSRRDAHTRANALVGLAALGARCADRGPETYLGAAHAPPVRAAAARWLGRLGGRDAEARLARCAVEELAPEVARACARPTLPPRGEAADVYAYAGDGESLLRGHLVALRFADGTALPAHTDAAGHLR